MPSRRVEATGDQPARDQGRTETETGRITCWEPGLLSRLGIDYVQTVPTEEDGWEEIRADATNP
jgi:hypothetical protein